MQEVVIQNNQAGQRLDKFLHKYLPNAGNSFLYKMLRKKNITLNGKRAEGKEILIPGDKVQTFFSEDTFACMAGKNSIDGQDHATDHVAQEYIKAYAFLNAKPKKLQPTILYENGDILLVNKPAGILTQKAKPADISLNEWMIGYLLETHSVAPKDLMTFKPSVCNRLDRNTSGIVLCGKTLKGSQQLSKMIKDRTLKKYYRTICKGALYESEMLEGYLVKDHRSNKVTVIDADNPDDSGEYVKIFYRPLTHSRDKQYTLLEVELLTGKTHQIRAQLSAIGHPLIGDYKYGDPKCNTWFKERYGLEYQLLHAAKVVFPQNEEGKSIFGVEECTAPLPEQFVQILRDMGMKERE